MPHVLRERTATPSMLHSVKHIIAHQGRTKQVAVIGFEGNAFHVRRASSLTLAVVATGRVSCVPPVALVLRTNPRRVWHTARHVRRAVSKMHLAPHSAKRALSADLTLLQVAIPALHIVLRGAHALAVRFRAEMALSHAIANVAANRRSLACRARLLHQ